MRRRCASPESRLPRLHVLVSEGELGGLAAVERVLERAAPVAVHLRAPIEARRLFEIAARLAPIASRAGSWLVVNGRPDVALAAGARAVQLGRTALGVEETRRVIRACAGRLAVGASVHDAEGALRAAREGADYLVLGTIYATPSHPGVEGSGPAAVSAVRRRLAAHRLAAHRPPARRPPPILAIGGMNADRVGEVTEAGAHGIVVGRAVWSAPDPAHAAHGLGRQLARLHRRAR
ncbi:MAG: thiamine phosphate synthase [Gemmatimonadota bacterium]|uniref:thiamine phosphate synthase n=1 Tax=Candidatus Palauibacter scopulicola TaxID=3056741 RepID=UPI00239A9BAE|nr:thiamine phosphate synthase [Candidatus Palauibacter scopulicola]MDE2663644.1 thiamine phosphate synthase [Candidatus Palauibacter scopulicola]